MSETHRLAPSQLEFFSLISERSDLNSIAGTLNLLSSQLIDACEGGDKPRPLDEETLNRWCDAASFLRMSVRRVIGQLEVRETEVTGKAPIRPFGTWDFFAGGAP